MQLTNEKTKYSDSELKEFKGILLEKLKGEKEEFDFLNSSLNEINSNPAKMNDGATHAEKESLNQLIARKKKFMDELEAGLFRIENKTYGICRETGKLIPRERLMVVPHTTLSMEAKLKKDDVKPAVAA